MLKRLIPLLIWAGMPGLELLAAPGVFAAAVTVVPTPDNVRYVGATTCQSSMCHGGASPSRSQFTIWTHDDFHSRAYATLTTARSQRIAGSLGLPSAVESNRCTTCHAPYAATPPGELAPTVQASEGVSCEHCHNAAGDWLRGHTRPDWTDADRVHAGLRDLRDAAVRATTCVACHQVLAADIVQAGHPELIFELDGQAASEPRHWQEKETWFGPKAWLVGQATALREISLALAAGKNSDPNLRAEEQALFWLLQQVPGDAASAQVALENPEVVAAWSNQVALTVSGAAWKPGTSDAVLAALSATADSFMDAHLSKFEQCLRAERLVMGLDRLSKSLSSKEDAAGEAELTGLFAAVQDRDHFDPKDFSDRLRRFAAVVSPKK